MLKGFAIGLAFGLAACAAPAPSFPEMRLAPAEVQSSSGANTQLGSSGVRGVQTKVLTGNPAQPGMYSILLFVPADTTIQAHSHRDNRMATVLAGEWHFGYGHRFDVKALKTLPAGSAYTEPGGVDHFAQTGEQAVVVLISGHGPTDTRYFDPANDPSAPRKTAPLTPHAGED